MAMRHWFDTEFIEDGRTIDLISIGVVAEDGREFYAISTEFDPSRAGDWIRAHVLCHLPDAADPEADGLFRTRAQIRNDLLRFIGRDRPEYWAFYADYDWVALCQLFGRMTDLPRAWPRYCMDIKQWCIMLGDPPLPRQTGIEHHALADARWNRTAWEFLAGIQVERDQGRR